MGHNPRIVQSASYTKLMQAILGLFPVSVNPVYLELDPLMIALRSGFVVCAWQSQKCANPRFALCIYSTETRKECPLANKMKTS